MKTIYHHYVEIADASGILGAANKFSVTALDVLAENDRFMVVNDAYFTTLDKTAAKYGVGSPLGKEKISTSANDSVWGNRITYSLYSEKRKKADTIRRAIEREIEKRFGFFARGIDLSVISDKKGGAL